MGVVAPREGERERERVRERERKKLCYTKSIEICRCYYFRTDRYEV